MAKKPKSKRQRWGASVDAAIEARDSLEAALHELTELQNEYQERLDGLSEGAEGGPLHEKLEAICDIDLDVDFACIDEAEIVEVP